MNKDIVFLIKVMQGGGAERVISLLTSACAKRGFNVSLILTHQCMKDALLKDIDNGIRVISLPDEVKKCRPDNISARSVMLKARIYGRVSRSVFGKTSDKSLILKYLANNYAGISWLKDYFKKNTKATVVAFLYDSIFYSLLSVSRNNKLIISERGAPCRSLSSKTTMAFLKNEFNNADRVIFQSPDVKKWYEINTGTSGTVIFNPVKSGLPEPFRGERKKRIVNFCRINPQKNLLLLFDAFEKFHGEFNDYELFVFGDAVTEEDKDYFEKITKHISCFISKDKIHILPAKNDIHSEIKDFKMFVSSSDFEGMSNSMLEAMAIGLPCVCTDCPAGGARAVIKDGENGLLVPVNDADALASAMKRIVSEDVSAEKLSRNAVKIRDEQSLDKIIDKWMDIING